MFEISAGGGGGTRLSDRLNAGHPGSFFDRVSDRFLAASASGVYRDIDNAFSAGGSDGNGSPQTIGSIPTSTPVKKKSPRRPGSSDSSGGSHTSARKSWDYYEAPLAEKYGFGKATAYQEALANTSYRREMEDMRRAGLNPSVIYASHSSSGADSNIYPREDSSGGSRGSGGSGGYRRRSGRSNNHVFSGGAYYGIMSAVGLATAVATGNVGAGMAASGIAATAMKAINGFFRN